MRRPPASPHASGGILRRYVASRRGAVAVQVAVMLVALIAFVSLGTEIVMLLSVSRHMQSAADAAALGAAKARVAGYPTDFTQEAFAMTTAAGFANGVAGTVVAVNNPPTTGDRAGDSTAIEVLIAQPQDLPLARVVYPGGFTVHARAVARVVGYGSCILTLETAANGLTMNGGTIANFVDCSVSVNSTSAQAVSLVGGSTMTVDHVDIAGGYALSGGAQINASDGITTRAPVTADPYARYTIPTFSGCLRNNYSPNGTPPPAAPGVYCNGITVKNGISLTLQPGVYIIDRGQLNIQSGGRLSGSGVTIVLTSSTGSNYATASVTGGASLNLTAMSTGSTAGLIFFEDRRAPTSGTNSLQGGGSMTLVGGLYFPRQTLSFAGSTASTGRCTQIVARMLQLVGNATLQLSCAGTGVLPIGGSSQAMLVE